MSMKLKLRLVDGVFVADPEVDGAPNEIAEFLKALSTSKSIAQNEEKVHTAKHPGAGAKPREISIPTADQLIAIIEERGRPFNFSMTEQQIKTYGTPISTKSERTNYENYYREFRKAKEKMIKKYGGHWDTNTEMINGIQSKRYTLIDDEKKQTSLGDLNTVE
jgi:hypothetical protein